MKFLWERTKAQANERKHGISFELAQSVFYDQFVVTRLDDRFDYGEERFLSVGEASDGRVLAVAHTDDDAIIRIISARKATRLERLPYEEARFKT
jgi:uncharacterized DUF497 family protein